MYNTSLPNVWSPALNPHPNPIITHFNYRIIPVGYCIIIVANIINVQLIDTCVTCSVFGDDKYVDRDCYCSYSRCVLFQMGNRLYN